jgi:hypothetical protein
MSDQIRAGQVHLIVFALVATNGAPVAGLGTAFVLTISKNGGAFAASNGTKAEISGGWYSYELTAAETDTVGPLAVKVTGAGAVQKNLTFDVTWAAWAAPAGTYILSATEASDVLRCAIDDPVMLALLPAIDAYIEMATGRDWAADTTIRQEAKSAARILLVQWHEDPGMMAGSQAVLSAGLSACLAQLEALALELETEGIPDETLAIVVSMPKDGEDDIAITANLVIIFNHEMAAAATSVVTLETAAGASVAVTNSLDVTGKILTVNPNANLTAATTYKIILTDVPDIYGQTIEKEIGFSTA